MIVIVQIVTHSCYHYYVYYCRYCYHHDYNYHYHYDYREVNETWAEETNKYTYSLVLENYKWDYFMIYSLRYGSSNPVWNC